MSDLNSILDGTVEEVTAALAELDRTQLDALRQAEAAGKKRKGVDEAIDAAIEALPADGDTAATAEFEASGAPASRRIDIDHPALDPNPTANAAPEAVQIDLNDPTADDTELVASRIAAQIDGNSED